MVDAVVSVFLEKLVNVIAEKSTIFTEFRQQFKKLQTELQLMQGFLKDADKSKRRNETLRNIMANLRELIYEAEDILADCQLQSVVDHDKLQHGCCHPMCFYPSKFSFNFQTGKRLREINEKISEIKQDIPPYLNVPLSMQSLTTTENAQNQLRWSTPLYDHSKVIGLETEAKKIKTWLFQEDHGIQAIGIVGMGGVGKTTIAQKIFDDREVEDHFERRMWISVSQTFSDEQIMRSMLRNLGDASVGDNPGEMLKKINQYLLGKRYLIVLDDVWEEDNSWWQRILDGLPKDNGNSVVITTRIEKVALKMGVKEARIHWPKLLTQDESWLLFCKIAFAASEGENKHSELETIGKEIAYKCKGLPLAIKALGGIMLCKPPHYHEWRRIANNFRDELAENDNSVMASLQLSYDELPPYLKSCFLCLCLFPEDCIIPKEQLVHWWIAEGFAPLRTGRFSSEVGEDCFSGLVNRCLVEVVEKTYNGMINTCKIHDMVRDLAIKTANDEAFSGIDAATCRRLGIQSDVPHKQSLIANRNLRAILSTTKSDEVNRVASGAGKKICECSYLRVLDLSKSISEMPLTNLLDRIGFLKHLTYINLSNTHPLIHLPPSLAKLSKLRILDLSYCQNLRIVAPFVTTFEELIVLDVSYCGSLEYLPKGLGRLSNLEVLLGYRPDRFTGCRIAELRSLTRLRKLGLLVNQGDNIGDDEVDALVNLQELQYLEVSCFDSHGSDLITKLEKLAPPHQLHELCLKYYPGKTSPLWLTPSWLPMLQYLSISSGNIANVDQCFWGEGDSVWKIKGLMLESLSGLEVAWPLVLQKMPSLRIMNISWCPGLESFPIEDIGFKGGMWKEEERKL